MHKKCTSDVLMVARHIGKAWGICTKQPLTTRHVLAIVHRGAIIGVTLTQKEYINSDVDLPPMAGRK